MNSSSPLALTDALRERVLENLARFPRVSHPPEEIQRDGLRAAAVALVLTSDEEVAILKEFEEPDAPSEVASEGASLGREEAKRVAGLESPSVEPPEKEKPREPEAT